MCAPWLSPDEVRLLQRKDAPQAWTISDLPLLDAARQRLGDPEAPRLRRRQKAAAAVERERMTDVIDHILESHDNEGWAPMLRGKDLQEALVDVSGGRTCRKPWSTCPDCLPPTRTYSPARSRTSSWTKRRN
jgi:hypothetical protein